MRVHAGCGTPIALVCMQPMPETERRAQTDRRRVPRGGRRSHDRSGSYPPILVADGYDGARRPAARYLERYHFDVAEAVDGEQALQRIVAAPPHVILTERSLPSMPAERLRQWLDQSWRTRNIPVIVMASDYDPDEKLPAIAGMLVKPFSLAVMLDEIRRVLRERTA